MTMPWASGVIQPASRRVMIGHFGNMVAIPNVVETQIGPCDVVTINKGFIATVGDSLLTAPQTGDYLVGCSVALSVSAAGTRHLLLNTNGGLRICFVTVPGGTSGVNSFLSASAMVHLPAGNTVNSTIFQDSGGALTPFLWVLWATLLT